MAYLPRGISPELLVSQVRNTMPYLFATQGGQGAPNPLDWDTFEPARVLRELGAHTAALDLTHFEYFRLGLCSHYLSCATPVPTDVDNQIRLKLWPRELPLETALEMSALVLASRAWDFPRVTARFVTAPLTPAPVTLSGHLGEWFTVAAAAYGALSRYREPEGVARKQEVLDAIADETRRHSEAFGLLWRSQEGLLALQASAAIAHNFGDLDRVIDMWDLPVGDPLRLGFYRLGVKPFDADGKLRYLGRLWTAGELYKSPIDGSAMALENHRHFALRKPRALRSTRALLIPTGPFFDDWGQAVARELSLEDTREVGEALINGLNRLPKVTGYGRALRGIADIRPELAESFAPRLDGRSRAAFERIWAQGALVHLDEIPGRA